MPVALSVEKRNAINLNFWRERQPRFERQLGDKLVLKTALKRLSYEQLRGIPVAQQSTLEYELDVAEQVQKQALREHAARGGRADKRDALTHKIESFVSLNPKITAKELLSALGREKGGDLIDVVDEDSEVIEFFPRPGEPTKTVKISALKHRLSRARKKIRLQLSQKAAPATGGE